MTVLVLSEHDVRELGRLREEEIDDAEKLQLLERLPRVSGVRERHEGVEADRQEALKKGRQYA